MVAFISVALSASLSFQGGLLSVRADSSRHEVVLTLGSLKPDGMENHLHHAHHDAMAVFGWRTFSWPVDGWVRGFRMRISSCDNRTYPRSILHHLIIANLDRRQLVHPAMERLLAVGGETPDVILPRTVGIPLPKGTPLAIKIAWTPPASDTCGISIQMSILWSPSNLVPTPTSVMPFYVDVQADVLASNMFDLPPGRSVQFIDFNMPVDGRLLAVGGHLHPFARQISLIALPRGDTLVRLRAHANPRDSLPRIDRSLPGVWGRGLELKRNRGYRVVSEYYNPADSTLPHSGMAHMVGLFAPKPASAWPATDMTDPILAEDYRRIAGRIVHSGKR